MIRPIEFCENIAHIRSSIDCIDYRILELMAQRAKYVEQAGQYNQMSTEENSDPSLNLLFQQRKEWASAFNIEGKLVESVFIPIIKNALNNELEKYHEQA